jgi:DNA replication protein DnaC
MRAAAPDRLSEMLTRLKLIVIRDQLDGLLEEAGRQELSLRETLVLPCEREITRKDERRIEMTMKLARFPFVRDLSGFDFAAQPSLDPKQVRELAAHVGSPTARMCCCSAVTLGREAILAGYSAQFVAATSIVAQLAKSHSEGRFEERLAQFGKPKLLIIDELGYLPFEPNAAHLFFQLVSRRYDKGAILLTSNRSVGEWGAVFGDPVVATAILDRLLHHSHVITIRGDSYRLKEKRRSGLRSPLRPRQNQRKKRERPSGAQAVGRQGKRAERQEGGYRHSGPLSKNALAVILRARFNGAKPKTRCKPSASRSLATALWKARSPRGLLYIGEGSNPHVAAGSIPDVA